MKRTTMGVVVVAVALENTLGHAVVVLVLMIAAAAAAGLLS